LIVQISVDRRYTVRIGAIRESLEKEDENGTGRQRSVSVITLPHSMEGSPIGRLGPRIIMIRTTILSALAALLVSGCWSPSAPESPGSDVIMPLKVGNMWIGEETTFTGSGSTTITDTLVITGEQTINGEKWFVGSNGQMYINRRDGLHIRDTSGCECNTAMYPSRSGDSIRLPDALVLMLGSPSPVNLIVIERVVTTDTTIQVPAGSYSTYHYRPEIVEPKNARFITPSSRYYTPNVGPIRLQRGSDQAPVWRWELVKAVIL
jgi:hypothetical protein